jgi:ABC-2 type transport system permease protein
MINALYIALNTLRVTFRKKGNIIVFLVIPVITVLISMALYSGSGARNVKIGVLDKSKSTLSVDLIENIKENNKFKVSSVEEVNINNHITSGKLDTVLVIPENFDEDIYNNSLKGLQLISIKGMDTTIWIENSLNLYLNNLLDISRAAEGSKETFSSIYGGFKNSDFSLEVKQVEDLYKSKSITLQSLGFLTMFMMLGATTTSSLILKERKNKTYYRILSSPADSKIYILGNIIANMSIMFIQVAVVIFIMAYILKINTFVPPYQLMVILLAFGLVSISFGVLIVSFSRSSSQASNLSTLIITPTCMLGGCFWDISLMPAYVQKISYLIPQRWTLEAINKLQTGTAFSEILIYIGVIIGFACAFLLLGIYKLRVSSDMKNFI